MIRQAWGKWVEFVTHPTSARRLGALRILAGILNVTTALVFLQNEASWFSDLGALPNYRSLPFPEETHTSRLFFLFHAWAGFSKLFLTVYVVAAISLTVGIIPRISAFLCACVLVTLRARNGFVLNGGEELLRLFDFFLACSPCGAALAFSLRRRNASVARVPALGIRLFQFQICLVYLLSALAKVRGDAWLNGTAVYQVLSMTRYLRFPLPAVFHSAVASLVLTYGTLAVEFLFPFLVWLPRTRRPMLVAALTLHIGLEYSLNIPLFQWVMLTGLSAFLTSEDVALLARLKGRALQLLKARLPARASQNR